MSAKSVDISELIETLTKTAGSTLDSERMEGASLALYRALASVQRTLAEVGLNQALGVATAVVAEMTVQLAMSVKPTRELVSECPEFWIAGSGRLAAQRVRCPHECFLTDSCPGCDADEER